MKRQQLLQQLPHHQIDPEQAEVSVPFLQGAIEAKVQEGESKTCSERF